MTNMKKSDLTQFVKSKLLLLPQASAHQKNLDVGANIFIGNLDPEVDEKLLYDTFSAFGVILQTPKVRMKLLGTWYCLCGPDSDA